MFCASTCYTGTGTRRPPAPWPDRSGPGGQPGAWPADRRCRVCPGPRSPGSGSRPWCPSDSHTIRRADVVPGTGSCCTKIWQKAKSTTRDRFSRRQKLRTRTSKTNSVVRQHDHRYTRPNLRINGTGALPLLLLLLLLPLLLLLLLPSATARTPISLGGGAHTDRDLRSVGRTHARACVWGCG